MSCRIRLGIVVTQASCQMKDSSRALPRYMYGDPADVVERLELNELGCRACVSHKIVFDRVICVDGRNEQQNGVPMIGHRCKWFAD